MAFSQLYVTACRITCISILCLSPSSLTWVYHYQTVLSPASHFCVYHLLLSPVCTSVSLTPASHLELYLTFMQHYWLLCNTTDWHVMEHYWLVCYAIPLHWQVMQHYWLTYYATSLIDMLHSTTDWHVTQHHRWTCFATPLIDMLCNTTDLQVIQCYWLTCYTTLLIDMLHNTSDWHVTQHYWLSGYATLLIDRLCNTYWLTCYATPQDWCVIKHHWSLFRDSMPCFRLLCCVFRDWLLTEN